MIRLAFALLIFLLTATGLAGILRRIGRLGSGNSGKMLQMASATAALICARASLLDP